MAKSLTRNLRLSVKKQSEYVQKLAEESDNDSIMSSERKTQQPAGTTPALKLLGGL